MRRKRAEVGPEETVQVPELRPATPVRRPESLRVGESDEERGRAAAVMAALGRVQLDLDLLERRLERVEAALSKAGALMGVAAVESDDEGTGTGDPG